MALKLSNATGKSYAPILPLGLVATAVLSKLMKSTLATPQCAAQARAERPRYAHKHKILTLVDYSADSASVALSIIVGKRILYWDLLSV
jgi:hypothetical protein